MGKEPPWDLIRIQPTEADLREWHRLHGDRHPTCYRVECRLCGARFWASGLGTVSHRRSCAGRHHLSTQESGAIAAAPPS